MNADNTTKGKRHNHNTPRKAQHDTGGHPSRGIVLPDLQDKGDKNFINHMCHIGEGQSFPQLCRDTLSMMQFFYLNCIGLLIFIISQMCIMAHNM